MTTVNTGESARPYSDFIADKTRSMASSGFDPETLSEHLFPFQRDIVRWALRRGKGAVFADTGLGKTPMMLEWAHHVCIRTEKQACLNLTAISTGTKKQDPAETPCERPHEEAPARG